MDEMDKAYALRFIARQKFIVCRVFNASTTAEIITAFIELNRVGHK